MKNVSPSKYILFTTSHEKSHFFTFVIDILTSSEETTFVSDPKLVKADAVSPNIEEDRFKGARNMVALYE